MARENSRTALVLSGGGARGAYQAGVLQGLCDLGLLRGPSPFNVLVGASAGALNCAALAAYADQVERGVDELTRLWGEVRVSQVFRTDPLAVTRIAYRWWRDLTFGGLFGNVSAKSLLDTSPLPDVLRRVPLDRIGDNIRSGALDAVAVAATDYYSGNGVLFLEGRDDLRRWERARYLVERTHLRIPHLLASSAIPFFFPTVEIDGRHFGDGCIRNTSPLSPAIQLGADRILAVGVRESSFHAPGANVGRRAPTPARLAGVLLDAVMLDAVEMDVDHCQRINESVRQGGNTRHRHVDVLWISPSRNVGPLVDEVANRIPWVIRYLLGGLGSRDATRELTSYLLFHRSFTTRLITLGRSDAHAQEPRLRTFMQEARQASR